MLNYEYKGFIASVIYREEVLCYEGEVTNLKDFIRFNGLSPDQAKKAFCDCVDLYLMVCQKRGIKPNQPVIQH